VDNRWHFVRRPKDATDTASSRETFIHFVSAWLRNMDLFADAMVERRFGDRIDAFAAYMRDERGLSAVTISTRIERLVWFFDSLPPPRASVAGITIADIDVFIAEKHDEGWSRASLCQLVGSLRSFFKFAEVRGWCTCGLAAAITSPRLYMREGIPEGPIWQEAQRLLVETRDDRPVSVTMRSFCCCPFTGFAAVRSQCDALTISIGNTRRSGSSVPSSAGRKSIRSYQQLETPFCATFVRCDRAADIGSCSWRCWLRSVHGRLPAHGIKSPKSGATAFVRPIVSIVPGAAAGSGV
jgi:hypothetical protein